MFYGQTATHQIFHKHAAAERMHDELQAGDDEWTFTVVYASDEWAYVECHDEDGEYLGRM